MASAGAQTIWRFIFLYILIQTNSAAALKLVEGHLIQGNKSIGRDTIRYEPTPQNVILNNDQQFNLSQNQTDIFTKNQTHGTRVRRSAESSSGACPMSKDELYEFYSAVYEILSIKTHVSKIPNFLDVDCYDGFQKIIATASTLNTQVGAVAQGQNTIDAEYNRLKARYEGAIKEIQDQINRLEQRKNENNPEIQQILSQINELTRQKNVALAQQKPLTDFQEARQGWLQTMRRCTTSKRRKRNFDDLFSVPTICPIQPQRLVALQSLLQSSTQSILSTFLRDSATAHVQQNSSPSHTSCAHRTQSLRSKLAELKDAFKFAVTGRNDLNSARSATLTRIHEVEVSRLTRQKVDLMRSINQKDAEIKGTHQSILQARQQEVNNIRTQNENLRSSEKRATIQFAAQLIRCKENTWAVWVLQRLSSSFEASNSPLSASASEQLIRDVVASAYSKNLLNLEKLLDFANQLPKIAEVTTAFEAIYEEMVKLGQQSSPQILLLAHQVDGVINSPESAKGSIGSNENRRLRHLESKLNQAINGVFSTWARNINSRDTSHIIQYPKLSVRTADGFNHYLPRLIQTAYDGGRLNSVEKLLRFGSDLHWYSHWGTVLFQLFKAMQRHGDIARHHEICLVAFKAKEALNRPNKDHVIQESAHLFQGVKDGVPSSVRRAVWDSWVKIWSRQWDGYTLYGSQAGNIYTYPNDNYEDGDNQRWTVHIRDSGGSFKFENKANGNYLYADDQRHAYSGSSSEDSNQRWMIIPESNHGDWVYIRNRATDRLLDANERHNCASSRECCCSTAYTEHSFYNSESRYIYYQQWKLT